MRYRDLTEAVNEDDVFKHVIDGILKVVPEAREIWFHGSRARGDHHGNSDWDFLVVVPSLTVDRRVELGKAGSPLHRIHSLADIQVATPEDAESPVEPLYWAKTEGEGRVIWSRLSEAPLADFQFIDKSEEPFPSPRHPDAKAGHSFSDDDRKALQSEKWKAKLVQTFRKTVLPINVYAYNQRFLNTWVGDSKQSAFTTYIGEIETWAGVYPPSDFEKTFGFLPPDYQNCMNILFVQNEGDERLPLTPWMVAHRIIHALFNQQRRHDSTGLADFQWSLHHAWEHSSSMSYALVHAWEDAHEVDLDGRTTDALKTMWAQVSTLTSARNRKIERRGEFLIELFTQFFLTGDFKLDLSALENNPKVTNNQVRLIQECEARTKEYLTKGLEQAKGSLVVF